MSLSLRSIMARKLFGLLPQQNQLLYRLTKKYVDQYNGDNNSDFFSNGEYAFISNLLPSCKTVFDVGANIGEWALTALGVNPNIELHCFEPSQATFDKLLQKNFPQNVALNRIGLSARRGYLTLNVVAAGSALNSIYKRAVFTQDAYTESILVDRVDNYCDSKGIEQIDFIKVDVEGHELEVFKGMRNLLDQGKVRAIQFEYGGCNLDSRVFLADIFYFFEDLGHSYQLYKLYPTGPRPIVSYSQSLETFQYSNWAFIRKD